MNSDDTFAGTSADIDELRSRYADDDNWREYKRIVLQSVRAGKRLEDEFNTLKLDIVTKYARQGAQERLAKSVDEIRADIKEWRSTKRWLVDAAKLIAVAVVTAYLTKGH